MNLILIVIDGLRADRLSGYGYSRPTSPFLDSLAKVGALFENFFTPVTPTQPAITTLFTGQLPITHGIVAQSGRNTLSRTAPWLPEILAHHGYTTVAVDNLAVAKLWFRRGFHIYVDPSTVTKELPSYERQRPAIEWLRSHKRQPFFLYIRYGDTHTPYMPPISYRSLFYAGDPTTHNVGGLDAVYARPLKDYFVDRWLNRLASEWPGAARGRIEDIEFVRAQYDAAIRVADDGLARLCEELERLGLREQTALVVLGDHGQELGEHGIFFEQHGLYDTVIHPPLVVYWPGVISPERRTGALTQTPDLAPTILEMAGLPVPSAMDGRSLVPLLTRSGQTHARPEVIACECTWMAKWCIRRDGHKLIVAREPDLYGMPPLELYDLNQDPGEQNNLAVKCPQLRDELRGRLEAWIGRRLAALGKTRDPVAEHGIVRSLMPKPAPGRGGWLRRLLKVG